MQRTHRVLHEALGSLIQQRPYEDIAVKEILARAQVARSTFYAHFRDKDELLIHSIDEVLRSVDETARRHPQRPERILAFSRTLYEHITAHRERCRSGQVEEQHALHQKVEHLLADRIAAQLQREVAGGWQPPTPLDVLAHHIAASFMRVLDHGIAQPPALPAAKLDRTFRALVVPVLTH